MRWKITIEGMDEFGGRDTAEMVIEKEFNRLSKGEIGLSISDGKTIMACLQQLVVKGTHKPIFMQTPKKAHSRPSWPRHSPRYRVANALRVCAWTFLPECFASISLAAFSRAASLVRTHSSRPPWSICS